jgi:hypothetical protein
MGKYGSDQEVPHAGFLLLIPWIGGVMMVQSHLLILTGTSMVIIQA